PQRGGGDGGLLLQDRGEIELALDAALQADDDQPAPSRERLDVPRQVLRADDVEDDVGSTVLATRLDEVLLAVVDDYVGAQPANHLGLRGATDGGDHRRAEGLGELDRGGADPAAAAVHEKRLALTEPRHLEHVRPDSGERLRHRARLEQRQPVRDRDDLAGRDGDALRVAAAGQQRADLAALRQVRVALADGRD